MRKGASGWLAKGLLLLLVASFGLWGIGGDMLGSSVGSDVIEVGDQKVSLGEFQREYRNRLNQVSGYLGRRLTAEEAAQYGVTQSTILSIQTRLLEDVRASDLALSVDSNVVADEIRNGPTFKNTSGIFDRTIFDAVLRRNGYSEAEYLDVLRKEIARRQLIESIAPPANTSPAVISEALFNYYLEKRSAEYIEIMDKDVGAAPEPTDEQLNKHIADNEATYTAPEYRKATFLFLSPEKFTADVTVTDEQIQAEYNGRSSEFNIPEKRKILQMIFDEEKQAQEAVARLSGGAEFATVASELLQLSPSDIDLGTQAKTELLEELQEPVFGAPEKGVTAPVKTILGWHLVQVDKIEPARTRELAEVRDQLKNDIALRGAADVLFTKSTELEDEFAGGATVEEAANAIGMKAEELVWTDRGGRGEDGKPVSGLPPVREFTRTLFTSDKDADVDLIEAENGTYFAVAVTDIQEAAVRSLEKIRADVTAAWKASWQHDENKKKADALLEKLKGGTPLAGLGETVKTSPSGTRTGTITGLSRDTIGSLFDLKSGEFSVGENSAGNGYVILGVKEIVAADKSADQATYDRFKTDISNGIQQDITQQYLAYLEKKIGFSVKENLIREYF